MTRETLREANNLNHTITKLEEQIKLVANMYHHDKEVQLRCDQVGSISITGALKIDILDIVLKHLNEAKDATEDTLRLL